MLSAPCDPGTRAVILDAPVDPQKTGPRERPLRHGVHMRIHIRHLRCEHVSATEARDRFQVLFATAAHSTTSRDVPRGRSKQTITSLPC
jgi:hypothetical protein